jgi:hypothetical protein
MLIGRPKAPFSTQIDARPGRLCPTIRTLTLTVLCTALALAFGAGTATAAPLSTIGIVGKCCHEGVVGEYYYANALDINQKTGDLYLLDPNDSKVLVFDQNGNYKFSFGSEGTGAGQLGKYSSVGLSVDQTTGDVYVSESGGPFSNNRISKFSESGEFILSFGRRVDETTLGDICTKASGDVCQTGSDTGEHAITFTIATVDPETGNVFVPHGANGTTEIYGPNGKYVESIPTPGIVNQEAIFKGIIYITTSSGFLTYSTKGKALGEIVVPAFSEYQPVGMVPAVGSEKPAETHLYIMLVSNATGKVEVGEFNTAGKLLIEHGIGMPFPTQGAIAVDPSIPHIYVGTFPNDPFGGPAIILGVPETVPTSVTKPVTNLTGSSATLNGTINPEGTNLDTFWHFEYRKVGTIPWTAAPQPEVNIGHGKSPVDVSQNISQLEPNTEYEYRLVASREFGGGTTNSAIATLTTAFEKPVLSLIAPSHVNDHEATIQGMVDPRHSPATYHFEYGPTTAYGTVVPLEEEGDAGEQLGPGGVFERLTELEPGTTYHFRLAATNPGGTTESGDHEFTTYTEEDENWPKRDIELVTNPDNGNQAVIPGNREHTVSADGNEIIWRTPSGAPGSTTGFAPMFLATRDVNSPTGWTSQPIGVPPSEQVDGGNSSYLTTAVSADFSTYVMYTTSCFELGEGDCEHTYLRVTKSGKQEVIVDTYQRLASSIAISDDGAYVDLYDPLTEELISHHNGVNTKLPTPACGYTVPEPRDESGNVSRGNLDRTFVQSNGLSDPCESPGIYMIDREANTIKEIAPNGQFAHVNDDGTRVIFTTSEPTGVIEPGGAEKIDYEIKEWSEKDGIKCLTCGKMPTVAPGRGFENLTVSDDMSHIYFWVRSTGAEENSCFAGSIYAVHHDAVDFVAKADFDTCYGEAYLAMTPDGNTLVFPSNRTGTTADNTGGHIQVFRYVDSTGYTECVSCSGTATPAESGLIGGFAKPYSVSADGSTIGYSTAGRLLPEDINKGTDVYEWHNGVTRLVTNGEVEFGETLLKSPLFWGSSRDGRVLAFQAGAELTGNERNHLNNGYAAVVGGPGFPPPNPPAHCTEDACQGPLQPSPPLDFQGSSAFHGPGNPPPKRRTGKRGGHHKKHHHHHKKKHHRHASGGNG